MTANWLRAVMWAHIRSVRFLIWTALLAIFAGLLTSAPLLNLLGFEFAFLVGLVGAIGAADLGAAFIRRARAAGRVGLERADKPGRSLAMLWASNAACSLLLLALPLGIISLNALRVRNCDWGFGAKAYVLLPVLSSLIGTATGSVCALIAGDRRKLSNALPFLAVGASAAGALWRFYSEPPVFVYNAFAGYYPGNLYDESISFDAPFYWARLLQLGLAVMALSLCALCLDVPSLSLRLRGVVRPAEGRLRPALLAGGAALLAAYLWASGGSLGFAVDADDIQATLGGRIETEHFIIYYPRGGSIADDIQRLADDHEFRYDQVVATLGGLSEGAQKIRSYYFADPESKFRAMGARRVHMAKPWRREIYLDHQEFPHRTLRHEISHVVAGEFGDPIFHVSVRYHLGLPLEFNVGLIEGIAVAADWPDKRSPSLTPHQSVKAMMELGMAPPLAKVLSPQFLAFSSARSYTVAGSFVRFVLERYGIDRLRVLYRTGGDFPVALGREQSEVISEWRAMLDTVELPAAATDVLSDSFRRPGILSRACPHAIARSRERVAELLGAGKLNQALATMRQICADAPGEPTYQLTLARMLDERRSPTDADEAARIREQIAADEEHISSTLRARSLLAMTARAVRAHDNASAAALLQKTEKMPLPDGLRRQVVAQRFALAYRGSAAASLRAYFWGNAEHANPDPVLYAVRAGLIISAEPDLAIGHYLLARNAAGRGAASETTSLLLRALDLGLSHPLLTRECARMLARSAYLAGDDSALRRAVDVLSTADQPEVVRLRAADWLERIDWRQRKQSARTN